MIFRYKEIEVNYEINITDNLSPCVLFLHGWGGSTESFKYFANKLIGRQSTILLDFPGFGLSSRLKTVWTVKDYAQLVRSLLCSLKINQVYIVAHSFGGRVAIELANDSSNNVSKLLLTGCAGIKKKSLKNRLKILYFKFLKFLCKIKLYKKDKLKNKGSIDYKQLSDVEKKTFINIINYDQKGKIKKIRCPTLLVWGRFDRETPFYFTKYFKKHIKDCEVVSLSGSHFAYLEYANLFVKIMFEFFK